MRFTNIIEPGVSRKDARRLRAASRLQAYKPFFNHWDSLAKQALEKKLTEFVGLCRNGGISQSNVYGVAVNILAPVADIMGPREHQHWLGRFNDEGLRAFSRRREQANG